MSAREDVAASITLAVIAGGAGSRMGAPKAWLTIGGKPILAYLLDRWGWSGPTLLVTSPARKHPPAWERFDCEVLDSVPDEGPLRGLLTALEAATTEIVIAVTCDMPRIEREQMLWLGERLIEQPRAQGLMLAHAGAATNAIEPFPCALRKTATDILRQRLEGSDRSVYSLARSDDFSLSMIPADWPAVTWTNLNLPDDLDRFLAEDNGA
jgi:molybdopterin-guanine dinucleotide biosynthesis protein A